MTDGEIDITFRSINDACLINAIEVEQTSAAMPPLQAEASAAPGNLLLASHDDLIISYYGVWTRENNSHSSSIPGSALDFTFKGPTIR